MTDQSAAADVSQGEVDLVAGASADILQGLPQGARGLPGVHAEGEDIETLEMTPADALAMVAAGEIVDAKTVILVRHLSDRANSHLLSDAPA